LRYDVQKIFEYKKTTVTRDMLKSKVSWFLLEGRRCNGALEAVFMRGKLHTKKNPTT